MKNSAKLSKVVDLSAGESFFKSAEWIEKWGKPSFFALLGLFSFLMLWQAIGNKITKERPLSGYEEAYFLKDRFQKGQTLSDSEMARFIDILKASPELLPLYKGIVLETYIAENRYGEVPEFIKAPASTEPALFPWQDLGEITILSEQKDYEAARGKAKELHALLMERGKNEETALIALNLLEIANLSELLGDKQGAKEIWNEIAALSNGKEGSEFVKNGFLAIAPFFQQGNSNLFSWIKNHLEN